MTSTTLRPPPVRIAPRPHPPDDVRPRLVAAAVVSPAERRKRRGSGGSSPSHQPAADPVPGFADLVEIGRGASGRVYRAHQERMGREVALKLLDLPPDDRDARRRFERELEITVRLGSHPHIVQVLDAGQATDGRPYLAMELFERGSAGDWLARYGPFDVADAVRAGAAIADALAAAHNAGVLHRDVKPENILLSEYGPALVQVCSPLREVAVTAYPVRSLPFRSGAVHWTTVVPSPGLSAAVGAAGLSELGRAVAGAAGPVPTLFVAVRANV